MRKVCLFLCVCLFLTTGCQRTGDVKSNEESQAKQSEDKKDQQPAAEVKLEVVNHPKFLDELKAQKGNVVLVDFWSTNCIPCMEKFPKIVKLYNDHRDKGLVCISAAILCEEGPALKFLKKVNSNMPNYLIDELPEDYQEHWGFTAIPAYYVFSRDGQKIAAIHDLERDISFEDIEKPILAELAKKK